MPRPGDVLSNALLLRLPSADLERLNPKLKRVSLELQQVVHEPRTPVEFVYFPVSGVVSAITVSLEGDSIEVATIGREGMVGLPAFVGRPGNPSHAHSGWR